MVRLKGFGSLFFFPALHRALICKGTDSPALPAGWSAAAEVREPGTERLKIVTGMLRDSAVQSQSSLYSFASIALEPPT